MRRKLKTILSLFCVLTLLFTSTGILPTLALDEAEVSDSIASESIGREETGLFVMTGLDEPTGTPVEASVSVPGRDARADGEAVSQPRDALPPLGSGSSVVTPELRPTVQISTEQVYIRTEETETVTVTVGGYPSGASLEASNSNSEAFSCVWGDWNGFSIPLRITGSATGGGEIRLSLKDTNNQELAHATIQVTIVEDTPTLTVSPADLSVNAGESVDTILTVNHYSGGGSLSATVADGSVCDTRWGAWSGEAILLTVAGRSAGTTRVTVSLYNSARTELASVTLNVEVNPSTTLTASPASVSVYAGESAVVTVSVDSAITNGDSFQYSTSDSACFSVNAEGTYRDNIRLVVTGESAGSGTLTVTFNDQTETQLSIPVTVMARPENERVTVETSSVTLDVGETTKVTCTALNVSGQCTLRCINNDPSVLDCGWHDDWSGRSLPVTITGETAGTGSVTIGLVVGGAVRSTATIQVTVCERPEPAPNPNPDPNPDPNPNPGPAPVAASPSYSFENYSKPGISLALCQYMFGDNQMARTVYYYDVGNGGVCFGLAATAGLLSGTNAPAPDAFGKTSMSALRKSDYSTTLDPDMGLSLTDFIEAMHISQVAYYHMRELSGVQNLVDEVRRGGNSQPAIVCLRGAEGGHALLAYGLTESGALRVYDSNYPEQERTLNISGENWSYDIAPRIRWNQSNGQISYIPYDTYYSAWHIHRGSLNTAFSSRYLLATTADNFSLTVFDANYDAPDGEDPYQRQVAVYADGALQPGHDENIEEVFVSNVPLDDGDTSHLHMLYVPGEELYTVRNDGSQLMNVTLSGDGLSVRVNSEAEKFVLAVSDAERFAAALLNGLQEGEYYSISVGSSLDGDGEDPVDSASIEGYGNGQAICLGIGEGLGALGFDNSEGLCVAGGDRTENADFSALSALSLHAMENDGPRPFAQDFALHSTRTATEYPLTARAGAGGRILPQNAVSVPENGNYTFRVQPDDGYSLKAIYVNGVQAAYGSGSPSYSYYNGAYEYTFRDVTQPGFLYAEFARDMRACQVTGTPGGGVTVTDGDRTLTEGVDYAWSVSGNQLVVRALADSAYSGVSMTLYDVPAPSLVWNSHNANEINLTARDVQNPVILAVAYSLDNLQMLTVLPPAELSDDTGDGIPVRIPLTGAALPRQYLVSVFMLSDTGTMRVLCAPVEVTISGAPATTS